jgi:hypothetical protein
VALASLSFATSIATQPLNRYSIRNRASSDAALSLFAGAADALLDVSDTTVKNIISSAATKACSPAERTQIFQ